MAILAIFQDKNGYFLKIQSGHPDLGPHPSLPLFSLFISILPNLSLYSPLSHLALSLRNNNCARVLLFLIYPTPLRPLSHIPHLTILFQVSLLLSHTRPASPSGRRMSPRANVDKKLRSQRRHAKPDKKCMSLHAHHLAGKDGPRRNTRETDFDGKTDSITEIPLTHRDVSCIFQPDSSLVQYEKYITLGAVRKLRHALECRGSVVL